jgi:pseudaminic acid cytidylyltransferase
MNIAIIPARGGSKRIPKKNIKDFCGKPIIAYSIEAAIESKLFDRVIVSTDSEEIKEVAIKYGAEVPFMRSEKNSDDYATTADVILETLERMNVEFNNYCCIYATAPFLKSKTLELSYSQFQGSGADSLIPIVPFSFPPQRAFIKNGTLIQYKYPENEFVRSQDLDLEYHDIGQFYWGRVKSFNDERSLVMKKTLGFEVNALMVQDIDNFMDWEVAEFKFNYLKNQ